MGRGRRSRGSRDLRRRDRHRLTGLASREIEERRDSPVTPAIVILLVTLALLVVVSVELIVAFAFYFGWL